MPWTPNNQTLVPAKVKFNKDFPPALMRGGADSRQAQHDNLLKYLIARLESARTIRSSRLMRLARIDKAVSTWQQLSENDSARKVKEETTGSAQAIHMNLPVLHAHVQDMISFFAEVFSPGGGDFFMLPKAESQAAARTLVTKLNNDAKAEKYYKNLVMTLNRLIKYNTGGFHVCWNTPRNVQENEGTNQFLAIDPYNHLYDTMISDPATLAKEGEWSATVAIRDQRYLLDHQHAGKFFGVGNIIIHDDPNMAPNQNQSAEYYRYSPAEAGLTFEDDRRTSGRVDWQSYGAGLASDLAIRVPGWEEITMYCWVNPYEWGFVAEDKNDYELYKFVILGAKQIIAIEPVYERKDDEADLSGRYKQIPHFCGYLNLDDMGESQRSITELLQPFASFASFLLNSHIDGTRAAIGGLTVYDPTGIDMSKIPKGEVAARIPTKTPGRDVRSIVQTINGNMPAGDTMGNLASLMQLVKEFFPAQALPSQIAGIDRAVKSQVAAVMNGVSRRLHMLVRTVDDDIMAPARFQSFVNVTRFAKMNLAGLSDQEVLTILGSGLAQLNREQTAAEIKELLFALIQNPETAQGMDIPGLFNWWSGFLNIPEDLTKFAKPQQAPGAPGTQPNAGVSAIAPGAPDAAAM